VIVFDTEGTDLMKPDVVPLAEQPHLVEFAGVKLDSRTLKEQARLRFLLNPGVPLPPTFTKITGITEESIVGKKSFISHYMELAEFFLGEREMVAHNLGYDHGILRCSLLRIDKLLNFPWPIRHICTVEASTNIKGHRLSMSDLHLMAAGKTQEERLAFAPGQFVKHKSLGKCTILEVIGDELVIEVHKTKKTKQLKTEMFKGAAFEGAHGAEKDVDELVTVVRWLRKEGHL
jgi:DNA polymerase III epsilon subunit-like protein